MNRTPRKLISCGKGDSPFADAVALWHMGDLSDSAGKIQLTVRGETNWYPENSFKARTAH